MRLKYSTFVSALLFTWLIDFVTFALSAFSVDQIIAVSTDTFLSVVKFKGPTFISAFLLARLVNFAAFALSAFPVN